MKSWIFKQGVAKGKVEGKAGAVIQVLEARGIRVSKAARARILRCTEPAVLDLWLQRAVSVEKAVEIFEEPAS